MKKLIIFLALVCTLICSVVCLAACANAKEYSVVCQDAEHGYVTVADKNVEAGEKIILAAHPSAGYKLTTFLLDGEAIDGVSFIMPEKDVTVSAQFELLTYSITYVLDDATVSGTNPEFYTVESTDELIQPTKDGYELCGWYTYCTLDEYYPDIEDYKVNSLAGHIGNLTLYAKYYNPAHEITYGDSEYGSVYVEEYYGQAFYGETYELTVSPYNGYELDCILINGEPLESGKTSFTMPACDVEISATFKLIEYSITYELDGGENAPENPDFYTIEDNYITFGDAQKDGYDFICWYYDDEYGNMQRLWDSTFYIYTPCYPLTLYAMFEPAEEEF